MQFYGGAEKCIPGGSKSAYGRKTIFTASRPIGLLAVKITEKVNFPFFRESLPRGVEFSPPYTAAKSGHSSRIFSWVLGFRDQKCQNGTFGISGEANPLNLH